MCNIPDVLSPENLSLEKMPFHPHIGVYNHCTCVEFFTYRSGIWYKILAYGAQIAGY